MTDHKNLIIRAFEVSENDSFDSIEELVRELGYALEESEGLRKSSLKLLAESVRDTCDQAESLAKHAVEEHAKHIAELTRERDEARAELEAKTSWLRIEGPGVDGLRVMLRELDPFDRFNRGDDNRDAIASGYWSDEYGYFVWPFGCTDHPPTHWSPMPVRMVDTV